MPVRPMRVCDICGGVDDHPRHVIAHDSGEAPAPDRAVIAAVIARDDLDADVRAGVVADLVDTTVQLRHMDCCRDAGCPDGSCAAVAAGVEDLRGPDLVAHLTGEDA